MRTYVLVEGPTDLAFLRRILPDDLLDDVQFVNTNGKGGMASLARSLLVVRNSPVVVLTDADSFNTDAIEERRQSTEALIRAANAAIPVKVVTAVPEIEAWFFAVPEMLEKLLGQQISAEWLAIGQRDPKGVLERLAAATGKKWDVNQAISALSADDVEKIRAIPEVAELVSFLHEMQASQQVA